MKRFSKVLAAVGAIALLAGLTGCANSNNDASATPGVDRPIRLGVVGASEDYWQDYKNAVEAEGIKLEIVDFSEYTQLNPALTAGEIDLNQFQHVLYLGQHDVASGDDLVPIGATAIYPLGLYSQKYKSVDEIPAGSEIAIPNDDSNQARALLVLQSAGLLKLKDGGSPYSTPNDIIADQSKVKVRPVEASLTATSLPDVAGSIVNNDFITEAGLKAEDAIAQDDPNDKSAQPYINIFAARAADANNPTYLKLVEIYQNDKKTQEGVLAAAGGAATLVKTPASELVDSLNAVKDEYAKHRK